MIMILNEYITHSAIAELSFAGLPDVTQYVVGESARLFLSVTSCNVESPSYGEYLTMQMLKRHLFLSLLKLVI